MASLALTGTQSDAVSCQNRKVVLVLTTAALKLTDLLSGPFLLNIPVYQRPYSWGTQQVHQLLDDLMEAAGLGTNPVADENYFLGTILLMDILGNRTLRLTPKMPSREFDVVDGQQRLVTLFTLFCVLRDLDGRKATAKRIQAMVVAQQGSRFFRTERFRMHLSNLDRGAFEQYVLPEGSTLKRPESPLLSQTEIAILAMREVVTSELTAMSEEARAKLYDYVTDRCNIVVIVSHDIDRAHRMFVVLNERGKQLQRDDILKADILSRVPVTDVKWIAETWDETGARLGKDFEIFFSHIRKIYGYDDRQIVSGVRFVIRDSGGAQAFMTDVFVPLSNTYQIIRTGTAPGLPPDIARRLHYLNRLADGDWAPAAMLAIKDWERDPERATMLMGEIDRMAHVMRLLCAGTGKRARKFNDIVAAIKAGGPIGETHPAFQLTREESRSIAFHLKDLHKRGPKICKLLLMRLGDSMSGRPTAADPEAYTIEHILPQRPSATSEWKRVFPSAEERSQCVESLGNLVLISQDQNDKARNASFEAKKAIYGQSSNTAPLLAITSEVLAKEQWTQDEIEEREHRLLALIANLFRIEVPVSKFVPRDAAAIAGSGSFTSSNDERRETRASRG